MTDELVKTSGRIDAFHRDPGGPFTDLARENYAKARARGDNIKAASASAGIAPVTGTQFEKNPEMRKRISELRQGAETYIGVSKAWIVQKTKELHEKASDEGHYKSALEALQFIHKIISDDKDVGHMMARALPHTVSDTDLKRALKATFTPKKLTQKQQAYVVPEAPIDTDGDEEEAAE